MRASLFLVTGCATGFSQTVTIGGSFGDHAGLVVSLEATRVVPATA